MNLPTFDLNLLRVLDALLREQNVSRAAERLSLSQPAVSNALGRLRELLDDPLLTRIGRRMQPTPRALALEGPIRAALHQIGQTLSGDDAFEPGHSRHHFRLAMTDYVEQLCMPQLMACLREKAPGVRLDVVQLGASLPIETLDNGELDLVLGRFDEVPARFARQHWCSEKLMVAACKSHPLLANGLDLEKFLRLRHLWAHGGQSRGMVDQWLAERGLARQIVYTTPSYLQAAHLVASSELCTVLPAQLAKQLATLLPLQLFELPFDPGSFQLHTVCLGQRKSELALGWLIEQLQAVAANRID
ncbi:LysR family transcriptional regulator [Pseudomonas putida]